MVIRHAVRERGRLQKKKVIGLSTAGIILYIVHKLYRRVLNNYD